MNGCASRALIGLPTQEKGQVIMFSGEVSPGQIVSHLLTYDPRGTQNDIHVSYDGQTTSNGPRLILHATSTDCDGSSFPPRSGTARPPCMDFGRAAGKLDAAGAFVENMLTVGGPTNGNPGIHEYKLFVVGDSTRTVSYTIVITYFGGPDY
jgi:hypothetical protein